MSVELEDSPQPLRENGLEAVGKRLADERRQQQLEVAAIAAGMHLRSEIVEALEVGDESALPAMTFVRGYIKSYSRLLGLDEQDVLAALPSDSYRAQPLKGVGMSRKQPWRLPLGKGFVWLLVIALLLVIVLYGVPLLERLMEKLNQPDGVDTGSSSLSLPLDTPMPWSDERLEPVFSNSPEPQESLDNEPVETGSELQPQEDTMLPEPASLTLDAETAKAVAPVENPATGPAKITMRFNEDSWVEMESHGRKLVVGTQRAGSQRTVHAEPPIQILLGNAPGVEISYRGTPVDLQQYQRGKVARLILED